MTHSRSASIIIPTYREAPNIEALVRRTFAAAAAAGIETEMVIVDDASEDGTEPLVESLAREFPVRILVRRGERGLSGAVIAGFAIARYDRLVVLDGDLQHPPERIPDILQPLDQTGCEFVMGSRYLPDAHVERRWPIMRRIASRLATAAAWPLVRVSDPMSGFFGLDRRVLARAGQLNPIGFKIALEILVKSACRRPAEVPIEFHSRAAGQSKLGTKVAIDYFRQLASLYRFRFPWLAWVVFSVILGLIVFLFWIIFRSS